MWMMRVIGFLYVMAGLWCAIMSEVAARSLGYLLEPGIGTAEFFTVYGGLEVGIGMAMIVATMRAPWFQGGLVFATIISWSLAVFRMVSIVLFDPGAAALIYLCLEVVLACLLSFSLLSVNRSSK